MAVTYGPLVVNNHARFGYLATPIVFRDFPAIVGSPYFLGVVLTYQEEGITQKSPSNKSTKKTSRIRANIKARPATINGGTEMPSKDNADKETKSHSTQIWTFSVQTISSKIIAPVSSQRGQNKYHKSKRPSTAISRSGKSIMVGGLRVRLDGSQPIIPRDRYIPTIPTSNRFSALRWFRGKQEDSKVEADEAQKLKKTQTDAPKVFSKRSNVKYASLQHIEPNYHHGQKRKGVYKKSSYTPQSPENIRVVKGNPTQQLKYRASVSHRIPRVSVFDRLGAIPNASTRPSKRRQVTWATEEKPKLIIFSCYASGNDSGEPAEQIAEATSNNPTEAIRQFARRNRQPDGQAGTSGQAPSRVDFQHEGIQIPFFEETNIQIEEGGLPTSNINLVIDLRTRENFQAMSDNDKYQAMQQCQSQMAALLNEMRRLTTSSLRHSIEPVSTQNQQHPDGSAPANHPAASTTGLLPQATDMQKKFLDRFQTAEKKVSLSELCSLKQKKGESAIDFIKRWREFSMKCNNPPTQEDAIPICRRGLISTINEKLLGANIKSFDQLNSTVAEIEMFLAEQIAHTSYKGKLPKKRKQPAKEVNVIDFSPGNEDTPAQVPCTLQIAPQIYPEQPPMSPYADSIGWLSEGPSTPIELARLYSFPRHQTFSLFRLCLQSGLMNYSALAKILANYCPYHQMMGHGIEDCIRFKDDVQRLIGQGIISLGVHQVNPPQPHTQQPPDGPANPGSYSVNVINASSSSGLPQSTLEEPSNPYLSSQWYTDARPLQQRSFAIKNTKPIFDNLKRQSLVTIFEPAPYIFQSEKEMHDYCEYHAKAIHPTKDCPDLHDLIETHIREGKIDQYGNSLAPANEVNGISEEAAAKPISQQTEEFVNDYHQLPSSVIEEAIDSTFQSQASENGWVTVGPRKSANSKRTNNSTPRGGSNKRSISKSSSEQKVISSLEALQIRNREKNRRKNEKRRIKKQMERDAAA
ncbi:hypothetical protein Taro_029311, partial [Colocasia esculenta]|nr:hypothetical protein [Colocasia esculenta]